MSITKRQLVLGFVIILLLSLSAFYYTDQKLADVCPHPFAKSLVREHWLRKVQNCNVDEYTVENEKYYLVEIQYGQGEDCPSGCVYEYKTFLLNSQNKTTHSLDGFYQVPDLSLGSDEKLCNYTWTSHLGALLKSDPEHIERSLMLEDDNFKWRLELDEFSGHPAEVANNKRKCYRTGTLTTNLKGENIEIIGNPVIKIK